MSLFETIKDRWQQRRDRQAAVRALASMGPEQAETLAADIGMSLGDLREVVDKGGRATRLLERTLQARGLAASSIPPRTLREIETTCSRCEAKGICARELKAGTAVAHAAAFCPNYEVMNALAH